MAMQQFSRSLPMMLYRALDAVMPRFRTIFNEFDLTEQQWRVLRVLADVNEIALKDLAELTLIQAPSLVGVVDRLQSAGLVDRRRSKDDRRVVFVVSTPAGGKVLAQLLPRVANAYADLKQSVDAAAWVQLTTALEKITSAASQSTTRPAD